MNIDIKWRFTYISVWFIGLLVLLLVLQKTIILPVGTSTFLENNKSLALVVWSFVIVLLWTALGDTSKFYNRLFRSYRSVWIAFISATLTLFCAFYIYYVRVDVHVQALRGEAVLLENIISSDTSNNNEATSLESLVLQGIADTKQLSSTLSTPNSEQLTVIKGNLQKDIYQLNSLTKLAERTTRNLVTNESSSFTETKGISFSPLQPIMSELVSATNLISTTFVTFMKNKNPSKDQIEMDLLSHFKQAALLIANAKTTVQAGSVNLTSLFVLIGILYAIFLLLPWLLLFLFLFRNLEFQVNSKQKTLQTLGIDKYYLAKRQGEEKFNKKYLSTSEISSDAFRNREYVIGLLMFTTVTAILWHFIWYPLGWSGLAYGIHQGYSVKELTNYLTTNGSTLSFGFTGAYFFVIQMLFRRYLAADLNPKPYINATVRMTVVFVLSIVLNTMGAWAIFEVPWMYLVAFIAGIFPMPVLQWIGHLITAKIPQLSNVEVVHGPLTDLDGINIWHEERLMEEGVENIQNLATAALDELIVHTNFAPAQLIHWVDQALLYTQVGNRWKGINGYLHNVGILTATDLCNAESATVAKAVSPMIISQNSRKSDTQIPLPEEHEAIKAAIDTMQTALRDMPNYLAVKHFWQNLQGIPNNQDDFQTLLTKEVEASLVTLKRLSSA